MRWFLYIRTTPCIVLTTHLLSDSVTSCVAQVGSITPYVLGSSYTVRNGIPVNIGRNRNVGKFNVLPTTRPESVSRSRPHKGFS